MKTLRPQLLATAAALAAVALAPSPAAAAPVAIGGGTTTLAIDDGAVDALDGLGISVAPVKPAKAGADGIAFPITGGALEGARGVLRHSGGLVLRKGQTKVALTDYVATLRKKQSRLTAKVNRKARLQAFTLDLSDAEIDSSGIGPVVSGVGLELSRKGAKALNATFDTSAFARGLRIGVLTVAATPRFIRLVGGQTDLELDEGAAAALQSEGITLTPAEGTLVNGDGTLGFPITGGRVNAGTLAGRIGHDGGITLTEGDTSVSLTDFVIDTRKATLSARVNGGDDRVAILALDLASPDVTIDGKDVTVAGVTATLMKAAADALNAAFSTSAFSEGLTIGEATVRGEAA